MKTDNELIAEFDGWTEDEHSQNYYRHNKQNGFRGMPIGCFYQNMMYHLSWDWLMPIIHKIHSLGNDPEIWESNYFFHVDTKAIWASIDKVYADVILFIKWYNKRDK